MLTRYALSRPIQAILLTGGQVFGARLNIVYLPHFLLYLLSHAVEMFVTLRYYILLTLNRYVLKNKQTPILYPKYMMAGDLFKLQPGYVRTFTQTPGVLLTEPFTVGLRAM
jgi:hypothetical protein